MVHKGFTFSHSIAAMILIEVVSYMIMLGINWTVAGRFGLDGLGAIVYLQSAAGLLTIVTSLGWPNLLVRKIATLSIVPDMLEIRKLFGLALAQCLAVNTILFSLALILSLVVPSLYSFSVFQILLMSLFVTINVLCYSYWEGKSYVLLSSATSGVFSLAVLATIFSFVPVDWGERVGLGGAAVTWIYIVYLALYSAALLAVTGFLFGISFSGIGVSGVLDRLSVSNVWLIVASVGNVLLLRTDAIMLNFLSNQEQLGLYGWLSSLTPIVSFGILAANSVCGPALSRAYAANDMESARSMFRAAQRLIAMWSVPTFVLILAFAGPLSGLVSGNVHQHWVVTALVLLAGAQLVNALTGPVAVALFMKGQTRFFSLSVVAAALLNVAGNFLLIPLLGALGACVSTFVSISVLNLYQYIHARNLGLT